MDQKQKEQLRVLLEARKRAEKVLAKQHEAQRKKQEYEKHRMVNQELIDQYTRELTVLAQACGILPLAEEAACQRGGKLTCKLACYLDYGFKNNELQRTLAAVEQGTLRGQLRPSHLELWITWNEGNLAREVEIRVHTKGQVTFHNSLLPIFPFLWRRYPHLLEKMLNRALQHPQAAVKGQEGKVKRKNISADDCDNQDKKQ